MCGVSCCPELWDTRLVVYRELNKKVLRWRENASTLNIKGVVKVGEKCDFSHSFLLEKENLGLILVQ